MTSSWEWLGARIPSTLKRLVDADPRDNQDVVEAALWREFGGERRSALETRIRHKDQRVEQIEAEIADLQEELRTVEKEREALVGQLDELETDRDAFESALEDVLDGLETGEPARVFSEHGVIEQLAEQHDTTPTDLMTDLKHRAAEQGRDLTVAQFKDGYAATEEDETTPITDAVDAGGDDGER